MKKLAIFSEAFAFYFYAVERVNLWIFRQDRDGVLIKQHIDFCVRVIFFSELMTGVVNNISP